MSQESDEAARLAEEQKAKSRQIYIQKAVQRQRQNDNATQPTTYKGYNSRTGESLIQGANGGQVTASNISNGLVQPGDTIQKRGRFADWMPRVPASEVTEEEKRTKNEPAFSIAFLLKKQYERPTAVECSCAAWERAADKEDGTGVCQQVCTSTPLSDPGSGSYDSLNTCIEEETIKRQEKYQQALDSYTEAEATKQQQYQDELAAYNYARGPGYQLALQEWEKGKADFDKFFADAIAGLRNRKITESPKPPAFGVAASACFIGDFYRGPYINPTPEPTKPPETKTVSTRTSIRYPPTNSTAFVDGTESRKKSFWTIFGIEILAPQLDPQPADWDVYFPSRHPEACTSACQLGCLVGVNYFTIGPYAAYRAGRTEAGEYKRIGDPNVPWPDLSVEEVTDLTITNITVPPYPIKKPEPPSGPPPEPPVPGVPPLAPKSVVEEKPTKLTNAFYLAKPGFSPELLLELTDDDPYEAFVTLSKSSGIIVFKRGQEKEEQEEQGHWCKITSFVISKEPLFATTYEYPSSLTTELEKNWQLPWLNYKIEPDLETLSPCLKHFAVGEEGRLNSFLNLSDSQAITIAPRQTVKVKPKGKDSQTLPLLEALFRPDATLEIMVTATPYQEGVACNVKKPEEFSFKIKSLLKSDLVADDTLKLIAASPIISTKLKN
ncbi:MAG: hypothetical protein KME06_09380 [Kastovskya adunca ATA6-11-RM4]|jgi:hypothetical protein|nr:hypothetical protein [Kastovskya adunca ATA6-11-RM4]